MPEATLITSSTQYASSGDFQRIFYEEKDSLYLLSFLLTADYETAQQCLVSGLEDSVAGNPVFKEWARSWTRRAIIQKAVRVINPRPMEDDGSSFNSGSKAAALEQGEILAVLELGPFERFVFVMSFLENYSEHECSLLLNCSRREVLAARSRALERMGSAMGSDLKRQLRVDSERSGID